MYIIYCFDVTFFI